MDGGEGGCLLRGGICSSSKVTAVDSDVTGEGGQNVDEVATIRWRTCALSSLIKYFSCVEYESCVYITDENE